MTRSRPELQAAQAAIQAIDDDEIRGNLLHAHFAECVENAQYDLALKAYGVGGCTDLIDAANALIAAHEAFFRHASEVPRYGGMRSMAIAFVEGVRNRLAREDNQGLSKLYNRPA